VVITKENALPCFANCSVIEARTLTDALKHNY